MLLMVPKPFGFKKNAIWQKIRNREKSTAYFAIFHQYTMAWQIIIRLRSIENEKNPEDF